MLSIDFFRAPERPRRLLMHKREINRLQVLVQQDGYALVPLSVYFKNARVKIEDSTPRVCLMSFFSKPLPENSPRME